MKKANVEAFYARLETADPEPKGNLNYINVYTLLVAVTLSAQATDVGVNNATEKLFRIVDTPEKMIKLGESRLKGYIKTIGLYNNKAKNVMALSHLLIKHHGGEVPDDQAALEALPGVGRKTANVVRNIAFGAFTIAVDTHIFRVSNRTGISPGKDVLEVEKKLSKHVPDVFKKDAHHLLILHGRYTCTARNPKCNSCIIFDDCEWKERKKHVKDC